VVVELDQSDDGRIANRTTKQPLLHTPRKSGEHLRTNFLYPHGITTMTAKDPVGLKLGGFAWSDNSKKLNYDSEVFELGTMGSR